MEDLNFIEAMRRFYEDLQNKLQPIHDELKKSVSEGKSAIASTLTENGVSTATDATFEAINKNVNEMAGIKYSEGVAATKKGTATADKVAEGYTFTSEAAGIEVQGTMKIGSSGSGGSSTGADLPTHLNSLSANGGNGFVTLTLGYTNTSYVSGVQVNYKTGSYPTSPSDGDSMTVTGAQTSIKVEGLTNALTYYFRIFLYNEVDGVKCYQTDITNARVTCIPRGLEVSGITELVSTGTYSVIDQSGTFTLTAPAGTRIIIGGGAENGHGKNNDDWHGYNEPGTGGLGGYVEEYTLPIDVVDAACILTLGSTASSASTLTINGTRYATKTARNIIQTKWGPIGGQGGDGGKQYCNNSGDYIRADSGEDGYPGTGAGGGGGASAPSVYIKNGSQCVETRWNGGTGGNRYGFGNKGGNGGSTVRQTANNKLSGYDGEDGTSGKGGPGATSSGRSSVNNMYYYYSYGNGGGGGYCAGGGGPCATLGFDPGSLRSGGEGGKGVLVMELPD